MRLAILAAALLVAAPALADQPASDRPARSFSTPIPVRAAPMRFDPPTGGPLAFRGALAVRPPVDEFGGLSALVTEQPRHVLAVTDKGQWARLALRIEGGWLKGVESVSMAPILNADGGPPRYGQRDAESLARDPLTGRLWVGFEGWHRLWTFDEPGGPVSKTIRGPGWDAFVMNAGIEALARNEAGRLWAVRETPSDGAYPVWILDGGAWSNRRIPTDGPWHATGAEFGPEGRLYLTERAFSFTGGFRFRLRRFHWGDAEEPEAVETLLEFGAETAIDNIEGVTLWAEAGRTFLLIASDDNFLPLQRNVLALFEVMR